MNTIKIHKIVENNGFRAILQTVFFTTVVNMTALGCICDKNV